MMRTISFVPSYCHALYKVYCLIATGSSRQGDATRSCKAKRQQRDDREMQ
jgi:hypothetical protein